MKAFPSESSMPEVTGIHQGMDLRDYFAAKAMQGMLADGGHILTPKLVKYAYEIADAMMKAREK